MGPSAGQCRVVWIRSGGVHKGGGLGLSSRPRILISVCWEQWEGTQIDSYTMALHQKMSYHCQELCSFTKLSTQIFICVYFPLQIQKPNNVGTKSRWLFLSIQGVFSPNFRGVIGGGWALYLLVQSSLGGLWECKPGNLGGGGRHSATGQSWLTMSLID